MTLDIKKINKIFFIGIGGIGISATAKILHQEGKIILGSDLTNNEITDQLKKDGVKIFTGQKKEHITKDLDLVVYSVAVPEINPERQEATRLGLPQLTYPQLLGQLMAGKYSIGVSGTKGKTTTTVLLGMIFIEAGLDPTIIVGGKANIFGGNAHLGKGNHFIFEGDEYRRAFVNYYPMIATVNNIFEEHLDYYRDLAEIKTAFHDYLSQVPKNGFIIANADDENVMAVVKDCLAQVVTFAIDHEADVEAKNIGLHEGEQYFNLYYHGRELGRIDLHLPARYNIYNALAASAAALSAGVEFKYVKKVLDNFTGSWRRFEKLGRMGRSLIIADYAHTPDALAKTISAIKDFYPGKKVLAVFQPHQYNRTKVFFDEFVSSFSAADEVIIADIFYVPGRENPSDFDINSNKLALAIKNQGVQVVAGGGLSDTETLIRKKGAKFDIILMMGAGDIYEVAKSLVKKSLKKRTKKLINKQD